MKYLLIFPDSKWTRGTYRCAHRGDHLSYSFFLHPLFDPLNLTLPLPNVRHTRSGLPRDTATIAGGGGFSIMSGLPLPGLEGRHLLQRFIVEKSTPCVDVLFSADCGESVVQARRKVVKSTLFTFSSVIIPEIITWLDLSMNSINFLHYLSRWSSDMFLCPSLVPAGKTYIMFSGVRLATSSIVAITSPTLPSGM